MSTLSQRQVGRFTGDKPPLAAIPPVVAVQQLQDMRFPGMWCSSNLPGFPPLLKGRYTGGCCNVNWDPPAGGFPAGELLVQLPVSHPIEDATIVASSPIGAGTVNAVVGFAPGVYDVWIDYVTSLSVPANNGVAWYFFGSGADSGAVPPGTVTEPLGPGQPSFKIRLLGMGVGVSRQLPMLRLAADYRWSCALVTEGVLTDPMIGQTMITVTPRALFDEAGNVF